MERIAALLRARQAHQAPLRPRSPRRRAPVHHRRPREGDAVQPGAAVLPRRAGGVTDDRAGGGAARQRADEVPRTASPTQRNNYKHAADYDIITLAHPSSPLPLPPAQRSASLAPEVRKKEHKDPTFQGYNIINGRNYDQEYLCKAGFRAEQHHPRHLRPQHPRPYNIVSGRYANNHEERQQAEQAEADREALSKSQELRVYDSVSGSFYNPELEEQFQAARRQQEAAHALAAPNLPPSYLNREAYVQADHAVPSQTVLELDRRGEQAKQRYKLRRLVEQEHRARGEYLSEKKEQEAHRRVHSGRVMEEKAREFNIISSQRYAEGRAEELFGKEVTGSPYKIVPPSSIKSRGFSEY